MSYSTKKIYRQKGTGGARHGDKKAPIFRHGGKYKVPTPRSHAHDLPKQFRALGLKPEEEAMVLGGTAAEYPLDALPPEVEVLTGSVEEGWPNQVTTVGWADQVIAVADPRYRERVYAALLARIHELRAEVPRQYVLGLFDQPHYTLDEFKFHTVHSQSQSPKMENALCIPHRSARGWGRTRPLRRACRLQPIIFSSITERFNGQRSGDGDLFARRDHFTRIRTSSSR